MSGKFGRSAPLRSHALIGNAASVASHACNVVTSASCVHVAFQRDIVDARHRQSHGVFICIVAGLHYNAIVWLLSTLQAVCSSPMTCAFCVNRVIFCPFIDLESSSHFTYVYTYIVPPKLLRYMSMRQNRTGVCMSSDQWRI